MSWWCLRSPSLLATTMVASFPSGPTACSTSPWATAARVATLGQRPKPVRSVGKHLAHRCFGPNSRSGIPGAARQPLCGLHGRQRRDLGLWAKDSPWRFTFDRDNGDLWAGDEGQNSFEEVDLVVKGGNYGWNTLECGHCFSPRTGCDPSGTLLPVIEYSANKGCSVIGGHV